jgi:chromosomal replication initiation ATPase DnaA
VVEADALSRMPVRVRELCMAVAIEHQVPLGELVGFSRRKKVARIRWRVWTALYAIRREDGMRIYSLPRIGQLFGRDHTTVLHGLRRLAEQTSPPAPDAKALSQELRP